MNTMITKNYRNATLSFETIEMNTIYRCTPKEIADHPSSYTGDYLKPVLDIHNEKNHVEYVEERKYMPKINPNINNSGFYRNGRRKKIK